MSTNADRNMLFGILALQMDFIDREQLVTAMNGWVLDKAKPLEQVLLDQGALDEEAQALLAALVQKHVAIHDGQPEKSLAAVSSIGSVREQLQSLADPDVEASLVRVSTACPVDDIDATASFSLGQSTSLGQRFRILRPHAKGGLGQVSVARDTEVDREVALKEIQERFADDAHSRERFTQEAMITGGLEHPGIVPVYGLGHYGNGRPYYAMRFIRGDSLKEAIARFHEADQSGRGWRQRGLELRKLLGRFVDVCHALEYAHSRGVLHRDLKPGNIMLGKYGETLVVDWGLAKAVDRDLATKHSEEPTIRPHSGSGSAATEMGSVLGTPAYMSPEQASGRLDLIGPATDVYGLGATLYCLLTGQAPFPSSEEGDTLRRVKEGRVLCPRQLNSQVPKALDAICTKAMALKHEDRYTSCQALADDIERYLADEPVEAYPEPFLVRVRRFVKHHQVAVTSAAAAVVVALIGASVLAIVVGSANSTIRDQNRRITAQNVKLETTNQELQVARDEAEKKRVEAENAQAQAEGVTKFLIGVFESPNPDRDGHSVTVKEMLDRAFARLHDDLMGEPLMRANMLSALGRTYRGLGIYTSAMSAVEQAWGIQQQELGPDHPSTLETLRGLAMACEMARQSQRALSLYEENLRLLRQRTDSDTSVMVYSIASLGRAYTNRNELDKAIPLLEESVLLSKESIGPESPPTLGAMTDLARAYRNAGRLKESTALLELVLQVRRAKFPPHDWANFFVLTRLADAYRDTGRLEEAISLYEEAYRLSQDRFGIDHPQTIDAIIGLASIYRDAGRTEEAVSLLANVLQPGSKGRSTDNRAIRRSRELLAQVYSDTGRLDEAISLFEGALQQDEKGLGVDHQNTLKSMNDLAMVYRANGQLDKAIRFDEELVRIRKEKSGPDHPDTLAAMGKLAMTYRINQQGDKAIPLYEEILRLQKEKAGLDHPDTQAWMDKCVLHYLTMWKHARAEELCRELLEVERRREPADPAKLAERLELLGFSILEQGQHSEAEPLLRESLNIYQAHPPAETWRLANIQSMLGEALTGMKNLAEAEPLLLDAHKTLGDPANAIPDYFSRDPVAKSLTRLVKLYKALDRRDEAGKWQAKLDERNAKPKQTSGKSEE